MKYIVSCASPVEELKVKEGDSVRVKGRNHKARITASTIENLTTQSAECECSTSLPSPPVFGIRAKTRRDIKSRIQRKVKDIIPKKIDVIGQVRRVKRGRGFVQFELWVNDGQVIGSSRSLAQKVKLRVK